MPWDHDPEHQFVLDKKAWLFELSAYLGLRWMKFIQQYNFPKWCICIYLVSRDYLIHFLCYLVLSLKQLCEVNDNIPIVQMLLYSLQRDATFPQCHTALGKERCFNLSVILWLQRPCLFHHWFPSLCTSFPPSISWNRILLGELC